MSQFQVAQIFPTLGFFLDDLSIDESATTITVWVTTCDLSCNSVSLMNLGVLVFGAEINKIEITKRK